MNNKLDIIMLYSSIESINILGIFVLAVSICYCPFECHRDLVFRHNHAIFFELNIQIFLEYWF